LGSFISFSRSKIVLAKLWAKKPCQRPVTNGGEQTPDQSRRSDTFQTPLIMFRQTPREIAGYAGVVQRLISLAY
jgi:hypothetical protein